MWSRLGLAAGLIVFAACGSSTSPTGGGGGGGGGGSTGGHSTTITVANNTFRPTPDTVPAGDVTFSWASGGVGHTVSWDSGPGTLPANTGTVTTGTRVFTLQVGTYFYHCDIHAGMNGKIVVQ